MDTVRSRVVVQGRVQGVWFRQSTQQVATELGVAGWVRNLPNGAVEAVFEGRSERVAAAVAWARRGPEHAIVTSLEEAVEQPEGLHGFEIRL